MKKSSLLYLFACISFFIMPANTFADESNTIQTHAGAERNFEKFSKSVVLVSIRGGYGTGTVVKYKKRTFVITAKHVVPPEEESIIISKGSIFSHTRVLHRDLVKDLAVLEVDSNIEIEPYDLNLLKDSVSIGDDVGYCGHPNRADLACFTGKVSGFSNGHINIHSYAFSGASGSLVIDRRGRAVGILSAIEVGGFFGMPVPLESVVWVVPLDESLFSFLDEK